MPEIEFLLNAINHVRANTTDAKLTHFLDQHRQSFILETKRYKVLEYRNSALESLKQYKENGHTPELEHDIWQTIYNYWGYRLGEHFELPYPNITSEKLQELATEKKRLIYVAPSMSDIQQSSRLADAVLSDPNDYPEIRSSHPESLLKAP